MIIPTAARPRNIENFSAIKNPGIAKSLLKSMEDLISQNGALAMRGLPFLKLNPTRDDVDCPILAAAFDHWLSSRQGDSPPTVRHIDPHQLRPALGWFVLVDLIDDGDDFVYRLFGSEIAWRFDLDLTGQRVSKTPAPLGPFLVATYRACVAARGPLLAECAFAQPIAGNARSLLLPWTDDGGEVVRVMAVASLRERRAPTAAVPPSALVRFRN
jgi:hypothetical protein